MSLWIRKLEDISETGKFLSWINDMHPYHLISISPGTDYFLTIAKKLHNKEVIERIGKIKTELCNWTCSDVSEIILQYASIIPIKYVSIEEIT
jgi:hypothetical protein